MQTKPKIKFKVIYQRDYKTERGYYNNIDKWLQKGYYVLLEDTGTHISDGEPYTILVYDSYIH